MVKKIFLGLIFIFLIGYIKTNNNSPKLYEEFSVHDLPPLISVPTTRKIFPESINNLFSAILWVYIFIKIPIDSNQLDQIAKDKLVNFIYHFQILISEFNPYFFENYFIGAKYLNIIFNKPNLAIQIVQKGLKYFPQNITLLNELGFIYLFDLGEGSKALKIYEKMLKNLKKDDSPFYFNYLPIIIAKLKRQYFSLEDSIEFLNIQLALAPTGLRDRIQLSIYSLQQEIDLACLNQVPPSAKNKNCHILDPFGHKYLYKNNKYLPNNLLNKFDFTQFIKKKINTKDN